MPAETRVHAICRSCLSLKPNAREPIAIDLPHCWTDQCCYCGRSSIYGLYYRDVERPTRFCQCTAETVYPYYGNTRLYGTPEQQRKFRTQRYYSDRTGLPRFEIQAMRDGDLDEHMDREDDDDDDP